MTNAERILNDLDGRLTADVELTLYGRAAFSLGFRDAPEEFFQSMDVDAVLWLGQAEEMERATNFWEAVDGCNAALAPEGLYISHLFVEDQVILAEAWRGRRVPIEGEWQRLRLYRLGDRDLFLSKLMRDDPQDRQDALFLAARNGWSRVDVEAILGEARVPSLADLEEEFAVASKRLLERV